MLCEQCDWSSMILSFMYDLTFTDCDLSPLSVADHRPLEPPQSNLKRFSSLENLAQVTTPGDTDESRESLDASHESQDDPQRPVKLGRGRGCNLSFRAAVDRSYDPVPQELSTMDPCKYWQGPVWPLWCHCQPLYLDFPPFQKIYETWKFYNEYLIINM